MRFATVVGHGATGSAWRHQHHTALNLRPKLYDPLREGLVWSNRDKRTPFYEMLGLIETLTITDPFYFVADAYYAAGKIECSNRAIIW
jgi:hypothetical protein